MTSSQQRGSDAVREVVATADIVCHFDDKSTLNATNLRKYFATSLQTMNLEPGDAKFVLNHMNHSKPIAEQYYCKKSNAIKKTIIGYI